MNEISNFEKQLPETIEDLSHFVLIGTEKLVAMRAEIRAITKCQFARELYDQKMSEQRMLSNLILDASVKIGELTKAMQKSVGGRPETSDSGVPSFLEKKSKQQQINELGFSKKQVERFEILANNKDIVEQVKQEARENDDIPTRSRVIDLVRQKKLERDDAYHRSVEDSKTYREYLKVIYAVLTYEVTPEKIDAISRNVDSLTIPISDEIDNLESAITKLGDIKNKLIVKGANK